MGEKLSGQEVEKRVLGMLNYPDYVGEFGEVVYENRGGRAYTTEEMFAMAEVSQAQDPEWPRAEKDYPYKNRFASQLVDRLNRELELPHAGQIEFYTFCSGQPEKERKAHIDAYKGIDAAIKFFTMGEDGKIEVNYVTLDIKGRTFTPEQLNLLKPENKAGEAMYDKMVQDEYLDRLNTGKRNNADVIFPFPDDEDFVEDRKSGRYDWIINYVVKQTIDKIKRKSYNGFSPLTEEQITSAQTAEDERRNNLVGRAFSGYVPKPKNKRKK